MSMRKRKIRRIKRMIQLLIISLSLLALVVVVGLTYMVNNMKPMVVKAVTIEAGTSTIEVDDFLLDKDRQGSFVTDLDSIDFNTPGVYEVEILVNKRNYTSELNIVDTKPPMATAVNKVVYKGITLSPTDLVTDIKDVSETKVYFTKEPNLDMLGDQEVILIVEDSYGNKTEIKSTTTVAEDTEPPVFYGVEDKTVNAGSTIFYKKGVTVSDNMDTDIDFTVDSSNVNLNQVGVYTVYYIAEDKAGNKTVEPATITVVSGGIDDEKLNEKVKQVLSEITHEGMTKRDKAWEIYRWIKRHVSYTGSSDKTDWKKEAYRAIVEGMGDCFTYYAVAEALLTGAGIDNMRVTRVGGKTSHYWNLINCGDGWYHFDSCPHKDKLETFMLTDAELEEFAKKRGSYYYNYDKSLYPATP